MHRFLVVVLFLLPMAAAFAQEKEPLPKNGPPTKEDPVPEGRVRFVRETGGHTGKPLAAVFTPDGKKLISVSEDRTVQVWDVATKERLRVFHLPMGVDGNGGIIEIGQTLVVDRQGEQVAFCVHAKGDKQERIRFRYGSGFFEKAAGDGWTEHAETGINSFVEVQRTDERIELFDKSRKYTVTLYQDRCTLLTPALKEPRFLQGGNWDQGNTFVCSLQTGEMKAFALVGPRDFGADGKTLLVADGNSVRIVDVTTGKILASATPSPRNVANLAVSPSGKTAAFVTRDAKVHFLDLGAATLKPRTNWSVPGVKSLRNVSWADDQTVICDCLHAEKRLVVLDVDTRSVKHGYSFAHMWPALPQGSKHGLETPTAIAGTNQAFVHIWHQATNGGWITGGFLFDWATGKAATGFSRFSWSASLAAAIAPNLRAAALSHGDGNEIVLWDPKDGKALLDGKNERRLRAAVHGVRQDYGSIRWFTDEAVAWARVGSGYAELQLDTLVLNPLSHADFQKSSKKIAALIRGEEEPSKFFVERQMLQRGILQKWEKLSFAAPNWPAIEIVGGAQPLTIRAGGTPISWNPTFVADGRIVLSLQGTPILHVYDSATAKRLHATRVANSEVNSIAVSPDRRYVIASSLDQTLAIYNPATGKVLLTIFPTLKDWIAWTPEGYYAGTPGGERLMGWHVDNGPDQLASFYPADRFRKKFYRPDVIKLILKTGSVADALKAADAALGKETRDVKIEDVLPPRVFLTVLDQSKLPTVKLKVQAAASTGKQPIIALRLILDGRPVPGKETLVEFKDGKQNAEIDWTFELPEGEHQLSVLARSPDSSNTSPPVRLKTVNAANLPTLHVLTVGINDYKDKALDLKYAAPDAKALAAVFAAQCKGQPFKDVKTRTLLDKDATTEAILRQLLDMRKASQQQDLVVVFFACHGVKQKNAYYLLTHEADTADLANTSLSGAKLRENLGEFNCQVLLMLDACHSAGFGAGKKLASLGLKPATDDAARELTEDDVGIAVLCAAMSHEKAEGIGGHGLFTQALLDALEKKPGVPFHPRNRRVYVHHLHTYVFDQVSDRSDDRQHPFLSLPWVVESFVVR